MAINIAKQLLGTANGQKVEDAEDSIGSGLASSVEKLGEDFAMSAAASELTKLGYPATLDGAAQFIDAKLDSAIKASSLSATAQTDLTAVVDQLFALVEKDIPNDAV
jgi:hypothetical protein